MAEIFSEDDLLPISALQHLLFCERRAVLVHLEEVWEDNPFTVEGRQVHERAHETGSGTEDGVRIVRGLWLRSLRLGLTGKADVVEFHPSSEANGFRLPGTQGTWRPFPVEYKRGRRRHERGYEIQVCAQALCLEEMLGTEVPRGALYYAAAHRRLDLEFSESLRRDTEAAAARLQERIRSGETPKAEYGHKCEGCSLLNVCLPHSTEGRKSARQYLMRQIGREREVP